MASPGACDNCQGAGCDTCGPGGADKWGHQGFIPEPLIGTGARMSRSQPNQLAGLGGQASYGQVPNPLVGGSTQMSRGQAPNQFGIAQSRPRGNQVPGLNIYNYGTPASSYGTSSSQNTGQSQGMNQSSNVSGEYIDPWKGSRYDQLLAMNAKNYQNVQGAFNQGRDELRGNLSGVYGQLPSIQNTLGMGQVLGKNGNWGVAQAGADAIARNQEQNAGRITQGMTSAGLGNTTAVANLQNQNVMQANQAYGALGADLANKAAGYQQRGLDMQLSGAGMQADAAWRGADALGRFDFRNPFGDVSSRFSTGSSYGMNNSMNQGSSQSMNMSQGGMPGYGGMGGDMGGGGGGGNPFMDQGLLNQVAGVAGGGGNPYTHLYGQEGINMGPQMPGGDFFGGFGQGPADPGFNPMGNAMGGWVGPW